MREAVLYARVSSKDQEKEGYSIPAQLKLLREYAQKNELELTREFIAQLGPKTMECGLLHCMQALSQSVDGWLFVSRARPFTR